MRLSPTRFTKIDGTAVAVTVTSAVEAKAAVKELKHKKRELKFLRGALVRRQKAALSRQAKGKRGQSLFWRALAGIWWAIMALIELATVSREERRARDPAEMERELRRIDETLHNIEGCLLQLEGRLLARG
jgi:hypothetical protein